MITEAMMARLPKAVRDRIDVLQRDVAHWRKAALAATGADGYLSDVVVLDSGVNGLVEAGLPPRSTVRFYLGRNPDRHIDVAARSHGSDVWLDVNSVQTMAIEPRASNSCYVRMVR